MIAPWIVLLCAALLGYTYVGYPLLLYVFSRFARKLPEERDLEPDTVSVVVVVHNGAGLIRQRILNLLEQVDLPPAYEIVIVSDGSTDHTVAEARGVEDPRVRVLDLPSRGGKAEALSRVIPECKGNVVVLADARQRFAPNVVSVLSDAVCTRGVGAVSGELVILDRSGQESGQAVQSYWSYEKTLRRLESAIDSTCGCTGACYAIRKDAFRPIHPATILDDVAIPMRMALAGYRVLFTGQAVAYDTVCPELRQEAQRKVRTLMGNLQICRLYPELLIPFRNRLWFQFVSHKLLRLATPFLMLGALAASVTWAFSSRLGGAVLSIQAVVYALGAAGMRWRTKAPLLLRIPAAVIMMSAFALKAWWMFLRSPGKGTWSPTSAWDHPNESADDAARRR